MATIRVWGGQGKPDRFLTLAELERRWDWVHLHPNVRVRIWALCTDHPTIGFLSGARSAAQQAQLYEDRGGVGVAPAGLSYHEDDAVDGWAVAADMIGDLDLLGRVGHEYGLIDFSDVNDEPWHVQPAELPRSRTTYRQDPGRYPLLVFSASSSVEKPEIPQLPATEGDDDMATTLARRVRMRGTANVFLVGDCPPLHLTPELNDDYERAGVPLIVVERHDQFAKSVLGQCGLTERDLQRSGDGQ